jgi:hypothetical protein
MNSNSIVDIDIKKYTSLQKDRDKTMVDKNFIQWCKDMNIGIRAEVKNDRAEELMQQYTNYHKWVSEV